MAHMIEEHDLGFVNAESTWHGLPQYKCVDRAVTLEEAKQVLGYELSLESLFLEDKTPVPDKLAVCRVVAADLFSTEVLPLGPVVGSRFDLQQNMHLLNNVTVPILEQYTDLEISSVGTMRNGAYAFVDLKLGEHTVKGDKSPTATHIMWYNPVGLGSYVCGAHRTRIVCMNTMRLARAQAQRNKSFARIAHTASAEATLSDTIESIAHIYLALEEQNKLLDHLADWQIVNQEELDKLTAAIYPEAEEATDRQKNAVTKRRTKLIDQFNTDQELEAGTRYALLNAFTYIEDHREETSRSDSAYIKMDGINGKTADKKDEVLQVLQLTV